MKAAELLAKLRAKGVALRLLPDGVMQYKDCQNALTPEQDAHVQTHRAALALLLQEEAYQAGVERLEDHLPDDLMQPCYGLYRRCRTFAPTEMAEHSPSGFATIVRQRLQVDRDVCGDCTLFHAKFDLIERACKREEAEAKKREAERMQARIRSRYFAQQQEEEV